LQRIAGKSYKNRIFEFVKKDIHIPEVTNVFMAAVKEWSDDFLANVWNVYLVNDSDDDLHDIMVVSKAFGTLNGEMRKTSLLRHALVEMPAVSAVKIELVEESVLALNNEFMVTFFIGKTLYDRKYIFRANSIADENTEEVPHLWKPGVIVR
jgi:hypothetical protein